MLSLQQNRALCKSVSLPQEEKPNDIDVIQNQEPFQTFDEPEVETKEPQKGPTNQNTTPKKQIP